MARLGKECFRKNAQLSVRKELAAEVGRELQLH